MIKTNGNIQVDLPVDQYRALIEMVQIADWVIHSHDSHPSASTASYRTVRKAILAKANAAGMGEDFILEDGEYYETQDYEENSPHRKFVDEFEDTTFWDELANRLARRDLWDRFSEEEISQMSVQQRCEHVFPLESLYESEFSQHGLTRLRVVEQWEEWPDQD